MAPSLCALRTRQERGFQPGLALKNRRKTAKRPFAGPMCKPRSCKDLRASPNSEVLVPP